MLTQPFTRTWSTLQGNLIFAIKVDPLNLESQNRLRIFSWLILSSSPIKIYGKSVQGFLSYDQTKKQTDKQRSQLYAQRSY